MLLVTGGGNAPNGSITRNKKFLCHFLHLDNLLVWQLKGTLDQ